jgi:hypothetical protein
MGLNIRVIGICGCDKNNTENDMEKISIIEAGNKIKKIVKCKRCGNFVYVETKIMYDDMHKGVKLFE